GRLAGTAGLLGRLLPPRQRHRPALEETGRVMSLTTDEQADIARWIATHRPELIGYATRKERSCSSPTTRRQLPATTSMMTPSVPCKCSSGTSSRPVPSPAPRSLPGPSGRSSGTLRDLTAPPRGYPAPGPALNIYPRAQRSPIARLIRIITKGH